MVLTANYFWRETLKDAKQDPGLLDGILSSLDDLEYEIIVVLLHNGILSSNSVERILDSSFIMDYLCNSQSKLEAADDARIKALLKAYLALKDYLSDTNDREKIEKFRGYFYGANSSSTKKLRRDLKAKFNNVLGAKIPSYNGINSVMGTLEKEEILLIRPFKARRIGWEYGITPKLAGLWNKRRQMIFNEYEKLKELPYSPTLNNKTIQQPTAMPLDYVIESEAIRKLEEHYPAKVLDFYLILIDRRRIFHSVYLRNLSFMGKYSLL